MFPNLEYQPIETARLILADISFEDTLHAQQIYKSYKKPEVNKYLDSGIPPTFEAELNFLINQNAKCKEPNLSVWWIRTKEAPEVIIGTISVLVDHHSQPFRGSIGYWLVTKHWRLGYMSESVESVKQYSFEKGLTSLNITAYHPNIGSQKVALKSGFSLDGVIRQGFYKNGEIFDVHVYTCLKS
jgi:[ribosomal protein S5]-alanine N-acetyltransferase